MGKVALVVFLFIVLALFAWTSVAFVNLTDPAYYMPEYLGTVVVMGFIVAAAYMLGALVMDRVLVTWLKMEGRVRIALFTIAWFVTFPIVAILWLLWQSAGVVYNGSLWLADAIDDLIEA